MDWKYFTTYKLCIGIWNVPTSSSHKVTTSLETLTYRKFSKEGWRIHKQEHHTTLVQRYGVTSPTTAKATFGRWDVQFMRCVHWSHHFKLVIWKDSFEKYEWFNIFRYKKGNSIEYPRDIVKIFRNSSLYVCKCSQINDHLVHNCLTNRL
jgi:hypothetical protein